MVSFVRRLDAGRNRVKLTVVVSGKQLPASSSRCGRPLKTSRARRRPRRSGLPHRHRQVEALDAPRKPLAAQSPLKVQPRAAEYLIQMAQPATTTAARIESPTATSWDRRRRRAEAVRRSPFRGQAARFSVVSRVRGPLRREHADRVPHRSDAVRRLDRRPRRRCARRRSAPT